MKYDTLLTVVFTDPQVARVGLSCEQMKERGISPITASFPFDDHGKSILMDTSMVMWPFMLTVRQEGYMVENASPKTPANLFIVYPLRLRCRQLLRTYLKLIGITQLFRKYGPIHWRILLMKLPIIPGRINQLLYSKKEKLLINLDEMKVTHLDCKNPVFL